MAAEWREVRYIATLPELLDRAAADVELRRLLRDAWHQGWLTGWDDHICNRVTTSPFNAANE
jgi:hypothetical protein